MLERDVEKYFVAQVKEHGGLQRKLQWIGRRHAPDRFVKFPGAPVALVELKRPGGKPRSGQQREIDGLRSYGIAVWIVSTREQVDSFIRVQLAGGTSS